MIENIQELDLASQNATKVPSLHTLEVYFTGLKQLDLSSNKLKWLDPSNLIKACPNLVKIDISYNLISDIKQIIKLKRLNKLENLNISGNPIDIVRKRLCLLDCLINEGYQKTLDEKGVVAYLTATYTHVPRQRPMTSTLPIRKEVHPNCVDIHHQRDILRYVSIEDKELEGILKMTSIKREGGNFKALITLNKDSITVKELSDILYYEKFPKDYEKQRSLYKSQINLAQQEYQNATMKMAAEVVVRPKTVRPKTCQKYPKERLTGNPIAQPEERPQSVYRFEINGFVIQKETEKIDLQDMANQKYHLQNNDEKRRIKETLKETKQKYEDINQKIKKLKNANSMKSIRYHEVTKDGAFIPDKPDVPIIQIQGNNFSKELMTDLYKTKEIELKMHKNTVKIMKDIKAIKRKQEQNKDILNQTFNSEELQERMEEEVQQVRDPSSHRSADDKDGGIIEDEEFIHIDNDDSNELVEGEFTKKNYSVYSQSPRTKSRFHKTHITNCSPTKDFNNQMARCFSEENILGGMDSDDLYELKNEHFQMKEQDKQNHILRMKKNFSLMVNRAYNLTFKKRNLEEARRVIREEIFKEHMTYEDLKSPELRLEFLRITKDKTKFRETLDYFTDQAKFIQDNYPSTNCKTNNPQHAQLKQYATQEVNTYEDQVLLYLNCKQNQHNKQDVKKLRQIINKLCPTDPESHHANKKKNVIEKIEKNLLTMDDKEFNRLQHILNLYSKLEAMPPSIKNFDRWLEINQKRQQKALQKEIIMKKHIESLPQTQIKRQQQQDKRKEEKRVMISLQNTKKLDNNYFTSPKQHANKQSLSKQMSQRFDQTSLGLSSQNDMTKSHAEFKTFQKDSLGLTTTYDRNLQQLIQTANESLPAQKLSQQTKVNFIEKQMSQPFLTKKKILEEWEPLNMKGTILEYLPQYNDFWNNYKKKVYPLDKLEDILKDPTKYNHTKKVLQQEFKKQTSLFKRQLSKRSVSKGGAVAVRSQQVIESNDDKKVIGSKFRFIKSQDELINTNQNKKINQSNSVDISLYLEDVCEDSQMLSKKYMKRDDKYQIMDRKDKIQKEMEKEVLSNTMAHSHNMLGRIARYAHKTVKDQQMNYHHSDGTTDHCDYVTRSEMHQVVNNVVQHYEQRIQALEQGFIQIITQLKFNNTNSNQSSSRSSSNVLQSNSNHLNVQRNKCESNSLQTDAMSTQNSESSVFCNKPLLIEELQQVVQQPSLNSSNMSINNKKTSNNNNQTLQLRQPFSKQQQENMNPLNPIIQKCFSSVQSSNVKTQRRESNSENKTKSSLFNLQQYQSSQDLLSSNVTQQSPQCTKDEIQLKENTISHEYMIEKEYDDHMTKQMQSVCTQDYTITAIQSPDNQNKLCYSEQHIKNDNNTKHLQQKEITPAQFQHNMSLSILLEEDSTTQNQQLMSQTSQPIKSKCESECIKDQRLSLGNPAQVPQSVPHALQPHRTTSSLSNKRSTSGGRHSVKNKPHCIIQKKLNSNDTTASKQITSNTLDQRVWVKDTIIQKMINEKQPLNRQIAKTGSSSQNSTLKQETSIARILMPSYTTDRVNQIRTPLGLNRSKTPNNLYTKRKSYDSKKKLNEMKENITTDFSIGKMSKFDNRMKEVASMKDFEMGGDLNVPLQSTMRTFDDSNKNVELLRKDQALHSSFAQYSRQQSQLMCNTYSSSSSNNGDKSVKCRSMFSINAESRLHSLVQTIQKYKNENTTTPDLVEKKPSRASIINMYSNYEKTQETLHDERNQIELDLIDNQQFDSELQMKKSEYELEEEEEEDIALDNFDLSSGGIKLNNESTYLSNQIEKTKQVETISLQKVEQSHSHKKSRNMRKSNEYFSFSNLEKEETKDKPIEKQGLGRSDTMVKLTIDKEEEECNYQEQQVVVKFTDLTGDVLDIISEYLSSNTESLPKFTICSSIVLRTYSEYKRENYGIQNEMLQDQISELKQELFDYFDQKLFKMSKGLSIIYYSNINSKEWLIMEDLCRLKQLAREDTILLKVYLLLLGIKPQSKEEYMQEQIFHLINENKTRLNQIFNPELHFTFGPQTLTQIGYLLKSFSLENYIINYSKLQTNATKRIRTLQILAQIIYEALQFCKIVPNRIESDIRELEGVIDHYTTMQDTLARIIRIKK